MIQLVALAAFSTLFWVYHSAHGGLIVSTEFGYVQGGIRRTWNNRTFSSFTGIPYAKPPIGDLRFKPPVSVDPWRDVYQATGSHNVCPQAELLAKGIVPIGDEDCLFLNVYTPKTRESPFNTEVYPVLVFLHGGSFSIGSAREDWIGPEILLDKDVVLVTVNYRLGALGFLSFQDPVISGNNGLKDQALAIRWVFRNIHNFGGDPNKLTLFGNSAGGVATHLHTMSPLSKHFLNSAIIQSGNGLFLPILSSTYHPIFYANILADCVNCPHSSSKNFLKCIRTVHAYTIINCNSKFENLTAIPFRPIVEITRHGAFLTDSPDYLIRSRAVRSIPIMTGVVTDEAGYQAADIMYHSSKLNLLNQHFNHFVVHLFNIRHPFDTWLRSFYFNNKTIDQTNRFQLSKMLSDGFFYRVNEEMIRLYQPRLDNPTFQYLFGYRGSESYGNLFVPNYDFGSLI
uniref:Carboxylic ester hydrolase n=1 Tax=Photinus pyralis TaxID=7054 RepID=A0A1Y1M2R0_PHOPY